MANIGFIMDSSGSLRRDYGKEKEFVKELAQSFEISAAGSRAGVVTFSYNAEVSIRMDEFKKLADFKKAVDSIPLMGYTTRIDKALRLAKEKLMTGARKDAPKLVFLLTDGSQTKDSDAVDPAVLAKELRDDGIKLIVIGIGKGTKLDELERIAGASSNVYLAKDFNELMSSVFVQNIAKAGCKKSKRMLLFILCSLSLMLCPLGILHCLSHLGAN